MQVTDYSSSVVNKQALTHVYLLKAPKLLQIDGSASQGQPCLTAAADDDDDDVAAACAAAAGCALLSQATSP
jgi:hypothetical protein